MTLVNKISSAAHVGAMQFIASRFNDTSASTNKFAISNKKMIMTPGIRGPISASSYSDHVPLDDVARKALVELALNPAPESFPMVRILQIIFIFLF